MTAVALVCEAQGPVAALSHVVDAIDAYVDSVAHCWSLERASECGDIRLLDRLVQREWPGVSSSFRQQRFEHAVEQAIRVHGHVHVLDWWMTRYMPGQDAFVISMALQYADVKTLRWLQAKGIAIDDADSELEVSCFTLEAAQWLHENANGLRMKLMVNCVPNEDSDHFEYLQWAVAHREEYPVFGLSYAMDSAAWNGQLEMLQWMHKHMSERCSPHSLGHAAQEGRLDVTRWLYETYPKQYFNDPWETPSNVQLIQWLASEYKWQNERSRIAWISNSVHVALQPNDNHSSAKQQSLLEVIQLLYSIRPDSKTTQSTTHPNTRPRILHNRCRYEPRDITDAMDEAAANGHLEILKWLHTHHRDDGCTTQAMDRAAARNHLEVVRWLHQHRSEGCTTDAMDGAIAGNHLEMVQWLHTNRSEGCTARAMDEAASCGYLEMVCWLHLNRSEGCTKNAIKYAAANGHYQVVKWLQDNRTEGYTSDAMDLAAQQGELEILQFLATHQQVSWTRKAVEKAAANGHLSVVQWFLDHQISFGENTLALRSAAFRGHFETVKLLVERGHNIVYDAAFVAEVVEYGQFKTAEWLNKQL